jgi:uncharacterized repeat protein (TIGR03806 family)
MRRILLAPSLTLLSALAPSEGNAELVNRWSFNSPAGSAPNGTTFVDSASGATATVRGNGATLDGAALTLPGTTTGNASAANISAYVDLPNGILSSKTNVTIEIWATPLSSKNWQRLVDFGRSTQAGDGLGAPGEWTGATAPGSTTASDNFMLSLQRGTNLSQQRFEAILDGSATTLDTAIATTAGTQRHYVITYQSGAGAFPAGGRITWYADGTSAGSIDVPYALSQIEDVNNWLGRSQFSGDSTSNAAYDEVRIYNHAMSADDVTASRTAGPNATFPAPAVQPDTITMHAGQKALIPVLANDSGSINPASVAIVQPPQHGTATPDGAGRILYTSTGGTGDTFTYRVSGAGGFSQPATVTVSLSSQLRIPSPTLNVPGTPPATAIQLVNALPGLSFSQPLALASPPGDTKRLFICEKTGIVKVVPDVTLATPTQASFLNLPTLLSSRGETLSTDSEQGLLGLAFHPAYATNRFFYVFYSVRKADNLVYERVSRFTTQAGNPNAADTASELVLIEQLDEASNHNGGGLAFGPDGYLYISFGDEGGQNDQYNNSQRIDRDFFSAIARIDVDRKSGSLDPNAHAAVPRDGGVARYAIPPDNPFVGATSFNGVAVTPANVRTEFWAVGLRNPWRFSFDTQTGELWVADVGQNLYEEIDIVTKGGNYGWAYREGKHAGPKTAPGGGFTSIDPVYEYTHGSGALQGNSITGGLVYRGTRISSLAGKYIFGDYVSGNIWALSKNGSTATAERITGEGGIVAFGTDPSNGDILVADIDGSRILRIASGPANDGYPQKLSDTGLFADLSDLSPNPGVLPYDPNLTFWSDHAIKRRWFAIPDGSARMTWSKDDAWSFPTGEIWVKHFDLETTRGNPATKKRIETRVLVKTATSAYGVSYRWNDAGTEATLMPDEGVAFDVSVVENGSSRTQRWQIPSRTSCLVCHTPQAGSALSFTTRQLNKSSNMNGFLGNQLDLLAQGGYFANAVPAPNTLPRHLRPDETSYPVEARVRSYLAVNCAYCHMAGGTAPTQWDGRPQLTLAQTGLINGNASNNGGDPANKLVVPGDVLHSVVYNRVAAANGFTRMPPLATNELDQTSIALIQDWIATQLPARQDYTAWRQQKFGSTSSPEGDPQQNPDSDAMANEGEYLTGTEPLNGGSTFLHSLTQSGNGATISFTLPALRSFQIESSTDLRTWTPWDVPGNGGLPVPGGPITITGGADNPRQFFRVRVWDN